jgi:hypothetical protein
MGNGSEEARALRSCRQPKRQGAARQHRPRDSTNSRRNAMQRRNSPAGQTSRERMDCGREWRTGLPWSSSEEGGRKLGAERDKPSKCTQVQGARSAAVRRRPPNFLNGHRTVWAPYKWRSCRRAVVSLCSYAKQMRCACKCHS